jgi:hypothetical protein
MRKIISASLAGALFAGMFAVSVPAQAQDVRIQLGQSGPRVIQERDHRDRRDHRRDHHDRRDRRDERGCTAGRALDKADRMGLRRARVVDTGRRTIEVQGRDRRGDRRTITFGRDRGCPVF